MGTSLCRKRASEEIPPLIVLCGGNSEEREVSIASGKNVHDSLEYEGVNSKLFIWNGDFKSLETIYSPCFIALHGSPGEDGNVQKYFEARGIKYTGSGARSCELTFDKIKTKEFFLKIGIRTPKWWTKKPEYYPYVAKPRFGGSSMGIKLCFNEDECRELNGDYFYEEYIDGREISVSIVELNGNITILPILEIIPSADFYDYNSKYKPNGAKLIAPAALTHEEKEQINKLSLKIFKNMKLRDFARIDGIIAKDEIYFFEVNSIPGMTPISDLTASARAAGISLGRIVLQAVKSACGR